jgi:hypothetical protein
VACQRLASLSRPLRDPQDVYERIFKNSLEEDYDCGRLSTAAFVERLRRDLQLEASDEAIRLRVVRHLHAESRDRRGDRPGTAPRHSTRAGEQHQRAPLRVVQPAVRAGLAAVRRTGAVVQGWCTEARCSVLRGVHSRVRAHRRQIIYIDDRRDYVAAGRALGMQAFVYDPALPPPAF